MPPSQQRTRIREDPYSRNGSVSYQKSSQILTIPIPPTDPRDTVHLNDEIDMYIPRKHVLKKFKTNSELLNNVFAKPYPIDQIAIPDIFPEAVLNGVKLLEKRMEIMKTISGRAYIKDKDGNYPQLNEEEETQLVEFIKSQIKKKNANDFIFGDSLSMKLYEEELQQEFDELKKECIDPLKNNEPLVFKLSKIDSISDKFRNFSANKQELNNEFINGIEKDIFEKYQMSISQFYPCNKFQSNVFDSEKQSISIDEWKLLIEKKRIAEENAKQMAYTQQQQQIQQQQQQQLQQRQQSQQRQQQQQQQQSQSQQQSTENLDAFDNTQFDIGLWQDDHNGHDLNTFGEHENDFTGFF